MDCLPGRFVVSEDDMVVTLVVVECAFTSAVIIELGKLVMYCM